MIFKVLLYLLLLPGDYEWFKAKMLEEVNAVRTKGCYCGNIYYKPVPAVEWNDQIAMAAARHAIDMAEKDYFSHISIDGRTIGDRVEAIGYKWERVAENIAKGQFPISVIISGWLESPSHCKTIMDPGFKHMGVAKKGDIWVQDFAAEKTKPRDAF